MKKIRVAVLGSGGREHALRWKLAKSPLVEKVYTLPGNGGIPDSVDIDPSDFYALRKWCEYESVSLIVVGPEALLAQGIADAFRDSGIKVFGPSQSAARLESRKSYAKEFMVRYGVSTAAFEEFRGVRMRAEIESFISRHAGQVVVKFDGLAAGKGVIVCDSVGTALHAVEHIFHRYGNDAVVVIEEKLSGFELSVIGITDGKTIRLFPAAQDHKRLSDNDTGPNTGGMGAYTPVKEYNSSLRDKVSQLIIEPTMRGLAGERMEFNGFLFFGILVQNDVPYLLEYNVRMGDPETEVLLPALESDIMELILACHDGTLADAPMKCSGDAFVDVVLASGGYPDEYQKGIPVTGLERIPEDVLIFHAGTKRNPVGQLLTNGGRVLNVVGRGRSFDDARKAAYAAVENISFEGKHFRNDIGARNQ